MSAEVTNALTEFGTTVTTAINPVDALKVIGIVLGAGATLYFTMWGAKKIITVVRNALKGRLNIGR